MITMVFNDDFKKHLQNFAFHCRNYFCHGFYWLTGRFVISNQFDAIFRHFNLFNHEQNFQYVCKTHHSSWISNEKFLFVIDLYQDDDLN